MEEPIRFSCGGLQIEGLFHAGTDAGAVISHPHPLYGGDMYNPVVETICRAYQGAGYSTLRFNFRGAGSSEGRFDGGRGELQDLLCAMDALSGRGVVRIDLAGYSFGAWVAARLAAEGAGYNRMIQVSPPVAFLSYEGVGPIPRLDLVVTGGRDDIAPAGQIRGRLSGWSEDCRFEVIEAADHFYTRCLDRLQGVLSEVIGETS